MKEILMNWMNVSSNEWNSELIDTIMFKKMNK